MIGFALSEDQVAAQKWAREFAEKEIRPVAPTTTRPRTSPTQSSPRRPTSACMAWTSTG